MTDDVASAVSWEEKNHLFWGKYGKWWSEACLEMSVCIPQGEMLQHHFFTLWKLIQITLKDWSICFYWKCQDIWVVKTSKLLYSLLSFCCCCCCLLFAATVWATIIWHGAQLLLWKWCFVLLKSSPHVKRLQPKAFHSSLSSSMKGCSEHMLLLPYGSAQLWAPVLMPL